MLPLILLITLESDGQQKTLTGKITDSQDGLPLPGVTIAVKGTSRSTLTDNGGNFSITADPGQVLIFSFVGATPVERTIGNEASIDVAMEKNIKSLSEVVVTAFGVEQEKRALGYSVQEVKSREITDSHQPNIVNALQGKVAGVQITNSGGAPGASAIMLIRGGTSLSGNNQPLYVVDGIPIDNSTPVGQGGLSASAAPASNRAIDINPEDIASITVLKGPSAAALYGLRAADGVVVITTKKGGGATRINYSNSFSFDVVNRVPELQSVYKQGEQGVFNPASTASWGPAFQPGETVYDNLGNFFKTAFTQKHDISASGGNDRSTFYSSASVFDQDGIVKNLEFKRYSFRLAADTRISDKLKVGGSANYNKTSRLYFSQGDANGIMAALFWPRNDDMSNYLNANKTQRTITGADNPYWGLEKKPITSNVDRIIAIGNIIYDPFSFLNITYRIGTDYFTDNFTSIRSAGTTIVSEERGAISQTSANNQITTSTLLVTGRKSFREKFNFSLTLGHNVENARTQSVSSFGRNFIAPDFPNLNNTVQSDRTVSQFVSRRRIVGAFGDLNIDYKGLAFLNFRARNDWSSTLPVKSNSFFYPSVSASVLLTDLLKESGLITEDIFISFGKIRAAWARVGKDAPPHVLAPTLSTATNTFTIAPRGFISNVNNFFGNPDLRPEFTNSIEIGTDVRFFRNRLGVDFTYYKTSTDDQILGTRTPPSSSTFLAYLNGGQIDNEGVELILTTRPVVRKNFTWSLDFNFSRNRATVKALPGTLDRVELSDAWVANNVAQGAGFLNGSLFGINGSVWKRDASGQLLLSNTGYPQVKSTLENIGDRAPDWVGGMTNTFTYKSLSFAFLWDIRIGGDIFNATENALVRSGLSTKTLNRGQSMVFDGIIESTKAKNTLSVPLNQNYYQTIYSSQGFDFVEDGSWYRLRYATLAYSVPKSILSRIRVQNLQLNVTGRNLILITNYSGVDPEVSGSGAGVGGSGSFGMDNLGVPATRGVDIGLRLTF